MHKSECLRTIYESCCSTSDCLLETSGISPSRWTNLSSSISYSNGENRSQYDRIQYGQIAISSAFTFSSIITTAQSRQSRSTTSDQYTRSIRFLLQLFIGSTTIPYGSTNTRTGGNFSWIKTDGSSIQCTGRIDRTSKT